MGIHDNTLNKQDTQKRILIATLLSFAFFMAYDFFYLQPQQAAAQKKAQVKQIKQQDHKIVSNSTANTAPTVVSTTTNANVTPVPKKHGILITSGPYKYIRHPMYLAQVIAVIPLIYEYYSAYRLYALIILVVTLLFKLHYEEKRLIEHFGTIYVKYQKTSKKVLPYIF